MEAPPLERKLIAILAADVEGYSRMMEIDEVGTLATLSDHRAAFDSLIARHHGRICGTAGDSVLAAFDSVFAAVECAVQVQKELADVNATLPDDRRMRFRIGINVGDVMMKDGDIFGDGVNIAARLEGLAEAGGICVSRGVRDQIRRKLPYTFEDLGEQSVKNIAQPIRVFRLRERMPGEKASDEPVVEPPPASETLDAGQPHSAEVVFWESIKDSIHASDYEAYLEQYPKGTFAALAKSRLEDFDSGAKIRDPQDREVELSFWESVRDSDNPATLQAYLEKYPDGEFRKLAGIRLGELRGASEGV